MQLINATKMGLKCVTMFTLNEMEDSGKCTLYTRLVLGAQSQRNQHVAWVCRQNGHGDITPGFGNQFIFGYEVEVEL